MRSSVLCLALLAGCGGSSPPSLALTTGVEVTIPGCPFTITTPNETTAPVQDDGSVGATPDPRNVHLAYVGDPTSTISVTWATDVGTRGTTLEWGADTSYGHTAKGFWFAYPADMQGNDPPSIGIHQVHLCGLAAGTIYHYRVGTGSHMSDDFTFATAPADGRPVRVLVAGDARGNASTWGQVLQAGAAEAPDLILFTGDANDLGNVQDEWEAWFAAGKGVLEHLPLMTVHGNHELNSRHYYSQFPMPANQQWFSFDFGAAHFTALNDTPKPDDPTSITSEQAPFLDADLAKTQQPWKLVSHHRPEFSSGTREPSADDLQMAWGSIVDAHHVDLVLNGHSHDYERTKPLVAGQPVAAGAGTVYIIEGGGGAVQDSFALQPYTAFAQTIYSYVLLDISATKLTLTAKGIDGSMVDSYSLTK